LSFDPTDEEKLMNILKIRLKNYRGVEASEVTFTPTGVSVIQGPNEIGKSSLFEGLSLLLELPADSKDKRVKAVKPVHRDAAPEVEAELEVGQYRFRYFKRYLSQRATELTIELPRRESLTGREAHDRVEQILGESMDYDLWRALRVEQERAVGQAAVSEQRALLDALDMAAGGTADTQESDTLFEAATKEYSQYYSKTGKELVVLTQEDQRVTQIGEHIRTLEEQLRTLELDVERRTQLQVEIRKADDVRRDQSECVMGWADRERALERLEQSLTGLRAERDSALGKQELAQRRLSERSGLVEKVGQRRLSASQLAEQLASDGLGLQSARDACEAAAKALASATEELEAAHQAHRDQARHLDSVRGEGELTDLQRRHSMILEKLGRMAELEAELTANVITDEDVRKLHSETLAVEKARVRLSSVLPALRLQAFGALNVEMTGQALELAPGEVRVLPLNGGWTMTVPGLLSLELEPVPSVTACEAELARAMEQLELHCKQLGLREPAEAASRQRHRQRALDEQEQCQDAVKIWLGSWSLEQMHRRIESLKLTLDQRDSDVTRPSGNLESAQRLLDQCGQAVVEAAAKVDSARAKHQSMERRFTDMRHAVELRKQQLDSLTREVEELEKELEGERATLSGPELERRAREAQLEAQACAAKFLDAQQKLTAEEPEWIRRMAQNAKTVLENLQTSLRNLEKEQIEVDARLQQRGEMGLFEQLEDARTQHERARQSRDSLHRRAAAARLLYDSLVRHRQRVREAYVRPLQLKIEELGRHVFDASFEVELGERLEIQSRTQRGMTVPFQSLSVGAREQLGILGRAACALIAGKVPIVLDDALGWSDVHRLEAMCELLAWLGRQTQIIILTCAPERYARIGSACVRVLR
jgi:DNA repair exonuclease SbcCD ATPase subunit